MTDHNWPSFLIQNPINIENYSFREKKEYHPKLLWVRAFHKIYNPKLAIDILCELRKVYSNAILTMVGADRDGTMEECKQLAQKKGVAEHIKFTGFLPKEEWIKLAESHDIFINTTSVDNSPVSVVEAMALGMIIISTNVGGIPYLISNNINGIMLEPDNVRDFVITIKEILDDKERGKTLSKNARITAENFSWGSVRNKWHQLLQRQEIYN
jgi:glycosyltransferase involved in cell wall biosynthesis